MDNQVINNKMNNISNKRGNNNRGNNNRGNNNRGNNNRYNNRNNSGSYSNSIIVEVIVAIVILVIVGIVVYVACYFLKKYLVGKSDSPWIIQVAKNAKNALPITQDPKNENSITLYRSDNQGDGAEFTYSFWFVIENMQYKFGELKHMFHKGNKSGYPNMAPGVYILENTNTVRIYMNTVNKIDEYVDIENIPLKRWVHMAIILKGKYLDIYVNGYLRKRHELTGVAKQNFGNLWLNMNGGFEGYMCKMRYYRRAIGYNEVENIVRGGPSLEVCGDTGDKPPYLNDKWWFDF